MNSAAEYCRQGPPPGVVQECAYLCCVGKHASTFVLKVLLVADSNDIWMVTLSDVSMNRVAVLLCVLAVTRVAHVHLCGAQQRLDGCTHVAASVRLCGLWLCLECGVLLIDRLVTRRAARAKPEPAWRDYGHDICLQHLGPVHC